MSISFDNSNSDSNTGGTVTVPLTCSGANRILFVAVCDNAGGSTLTTKTYNGVTMTQIGSVFNAPSTRDYYLFYIIAPATGGANIVITSSGGNTVWVQAMSFTGAKQSAQPDATSSVVNPSGSTASYSQSVTTVADNCFQVMLGVANSGNSVTASTNTTVQINESTNTNRQFFAYSTTAKTPAGSATLAVTSTAQTFSSVTVSFSPVVASNTSNMLLVM